MSLWAKSVQIFNSIREFGKPSIRCLAERTGFSKSSVHRHLQAASRRDRYPESGLWETPEGRDWLIRLVVATFFIFGRLHLESHLGCSPSALRRLTQRLEQTILEITSTWEQDGIQHGELRPIIGAVDETFLQRMMLVFMDLASGYLVMEEVAVDRTYETWSGLVKARLNTLGVEVSYVVSDRAKALIKLAETGLNCLSIPDLFHLGHDLAKSYSLAIFSRLRQSQQALTQAQERLATVQGSQPGRAQLQQVQAVVADCEVGVKRWQDVRSAYRTHLANLSLILHPWKLVGSTRQTSSDVDQRLRAEVDALETLIGTHGLPAKIDTLTKVRKQLTGLSGLIDFWWQRVERDLEEMPLDADWKHWVDEVLLPMMYLKEKLSRTRCPAQKSKLTSALQVIEEGFERHPCTRQIEVEVLADWKR